MLNGKKIHFIMPLFLIIFVTVFIAMIPMTNNGNVVEIFGEDGHWDLTEAQIDDAVIRLKGVERYIPDRLVSPTEFEKFNGDVVIGPTNSLNQFTSQIRIEVPDDGWYTISRTLTGYAHQIFVNGEARLEVGILGETQVTSVARSMQVILDVKPVDGVIELTTLSINPPHRWGSSHHYWHIGHANVIDYVRSSDFISNLMMGSFFALFLLHMSMFLMDSQYRSNAYFALFNLVMFFRLGAESMGIFSVIYPNRSWQLMFYIEYFTVPLIALFIIIIANELLPKDILPKTFRHIIYGTSMSFMLIFIFGTSQTMSHVMVVAYIFYILAILYGSLYGFMQVIQRMKQLTLEQWILVAGFAFVLLTLLADIIHHSTADMIANLPVVSALSIAYFSLCVAVVVLISSRKAATAIKMSQQQLTMEVYTLEKVNEAKIELIENIAHEVRMPLSVLASYAGLVALELKLKAKTNRMIGNLEKIITEAKRISSLIEKLKNAPMFELDNKDHVNLNLSVLIEQIVHLYRHLFEKNKIGLILTIEKDLVMAASAHKITQLLFNLLQNAKNHTSSGKVTIIAKEEQDQIVLKICDTGTGIAPELLPHLFTRGVMASSGGSGIGLAVCKEIVNAHHGTIHVESETSGLNRGTKMTIIFPKVRKDDENEAM